MNLPAWLVAAHDDTVTRWREQVLAVVPEEERAAARIQESGRQSGPTRRAGS